MSTDDQCFKQVNFTLAQLVTSFGVVELEVLVREDVFAIDGIAACSVVVYEIASLNHEAWDDPVECGSLVPQRFAIRTHSFLPCVTWKLRVLYKTGIRERCTAKPLLWRDLSLQ